MMIFPAITALCAGLLGVIGVILAAQAGFYRGTAKVGIGDGGNEELFCRIRRHGNFTEYTPFALILLGFLEMSATTGQIAIIILGAMLVIGRILHPLGLKVNGAPTIFRAVGMIGTIPMILITSIWLIYNYVTAM